LASLLPRNEHIACDARVKPNLFINESATIRVIIGVKYFQMATLPLNSPNLRPIDIRNDLAPIADLIELCFKDHLDADGRVYLDQMRRAARNTQYLIWAMNTKIQMPVSGYVWEDAGRITGNVSLLPVNKDGRRVFMIANVAVHPDYRRLGIGRALTEQALAYCSSQNSQAAWLQVRDDNPGAQHIYTSLGFVERIRRATWIVDPAHYTQPSISNPAFKPGKRKAADWELQSIWLDEIYPPVVRWNLPFRRDVFRPGFKQDLWRFFNDLYIHHWVARQDQQLAGIVSWTPSHLAEDNLWLAPAPGLEDEAILCAIPAAITSPAAHRSLTLNYPAGRGDAALLSAGLTKENTLIWMEKKLPVVNP
jgi:ribosomal protein S18 acetylase RimI-like enzyme